MAGQSRMLTQGRTVLPMTGGLAATLSDRRGALLMEIAIAVAIFGVVGSAVLTGLSTSHMASAVTQEQSLAENIARNQMEYVFSLPYSAPTSTYPSVVAPSGYTVTALAEEYLLGDPNIEKVVVTIQHSGVTVLTLESLRTDG